MAEKDIETSIKEISMMRKRINYIDAAIIRLISRRNTLSKQIGQKKKEINMPVYAKEREEDALKTRKRHAMMKNLDPKIIEKIFKPIIIESRNIQKKK